MASSALNDFAKYSHINMKIVLMLMKHCFGAKIIHLHAVWPMLTAIKSVFPTVSIMSDA